MEAVAWIIASMTYSRTSKQKRKKLNHTFTQKSVNLLSNLVARFRHKSLGISIFCCRRHRTFQTDPFKMLSGQLNVLLMHTLRWAQNTFVVNSQFNYKFMVNKKVPHSWSYVLSTFFSVVTLIFDLHFRIESDSDSFTINKSANHVGPRSFSSKLFSRHTPDRLLYLDHWNVGRKQCTRVLISFTAEQR